MSAGKCRTCLKFSRNLIPFNAPAFNDMPYLKISTVVSICCNMQLKEKEKPDMICDSCLDEARKSYQFRKMFENSELSANDNQNNHFIRSPYFTVKRENNGIINMTDQGQSQQEYSFVDLTKYDDLESCDMSSLELSLKEDLDKVTAMDNAGNGATGAEQSQNSIRLVDLHTLTVGGNPTSADETRAEEEVAPDMDLLSAAEPALSTIQEEEVEGNLENDSEPEDVRKSNRRRKSRILNETPASKQRARSSSVSHKTQSKFGNFVNNKLHVCNECGAEFVQKKSLDIHKRTHLQRVCCMCACDGQNYLAPHMNVGSHLFKEEPRFSCDVCKKTFRDAYHLQRHKVVHTQCTLCNFVPVNRIELKTHMGINHAEHRNGRAPRTSGRVQKRNAKSTKEQASPRDVDSAVEVAKKTLPCPYCAKCFNKPFYLKRHLRHSCKSFKPSF